jgi:hypothetical protein
LGEKLVTVFGDQGKKLSTLPHTLLIECCLDAEKVIFIP